MSTSSARFKVIVKDHAEYALARLRCRLMALALGPIAPDAAADAKVEAAIHTAIYEFDSITGYDDGTRSKCVVRWTQQFIDEFQPIEDAEVAAAAAVAELVVAS